MPTVWHACLLFGQSSPGLLLCAKSPRLMDGVPSANLEDAEERGELPHRTHKDENPYNKS